jgi:hypothetical protein
MNIPKRYRAECEGEWTCATPARTNKTNVKKAAMGCTMRMAERVVRVLTGRSKVFVCSAL